MGSRTGAVGNIDRIGKALQGKALASNSARSADTGGVTSAVITKRWARSLSCRLLGI